MKKITRINGVDCKIGRNSRTGSTISMIVPDEDIINVVSYFNDFKGGNEPTGKVKKIELVIYEDQDELETIEGLRAENKEMREIIDNLDTVVKSSEALIDSVVIEETPKLKDLKCSCGKTYEWKNVRWGDDYSNIIYACECGCSTIGGEDLTRMVSLWDRAKNDTSLLKLFIENVLEEEFIEAPKEHLPANQPDLKVYEKKCETHTYVKGKCANCGGVES